VADVKPVLILDGPGNAATAALILPDYECFSFVDAPTPGQLSGRHVIFWSLDAPAALKMAGKYFEHVQKTAVVEAELDFNDALKERMTGDAVVDYMLSRLRPIERRSRSTAKKANGHDNGKLNGNGHFHETEKSVEPSQAVAQQSQALVTWQALNLDCDAKNVPHATIANAALILCAHPEIQDRIWYDDLACKVMQTVGGVDSLWSDAEDLQVCIWLQQTLKLPRLSLQTAVHAIQAVAYQRRRNPLTAWLERLEWDKTVRLDSWLSDYLRAPNTAYTQAVGRNWLVSMAARAYRPGCQADHMPVLEGKMGKGKSSALAILGGKWYKAAPQAFGSKEFLEVIQGAWLVEIPDMVGFGKREHSQIISAITTRTDSYRAAYARHATQHPRACIFAATSENDEYLQEARGIRRYWPVRCGDINLELLASMREQLLAEAVFAFKAGALWHEMPELETRAEQVSRVYQHPWTDAIVQYAEAVGEFTSADALRSAIEMDLDAQTDGHKSAVYKILTANGWEQTNTTRKGERLRLWRRRAPT
jgi:hypothetical protein